MEYSKNLKVLEQFRPELYQKIRNLDFEELERKTEQVVNTQARDGSLITSVTKDGKQVRLNSAFRPIEEAKKWVRQYEFNNLNNHVTMYGFGNGYFVKQLLSNMPEKDYLLVYEPCTELFINALHNFDLESILKDKRFIIGVEGINQFVFYEAVHQIYGIQSIANLKFVLHPGYDKLFQKEFDESYRIEIQKSIDSAQIDYNTLLGLGESNLKNIFENIPKLKDSISVTQVKELWDSEIPVIVVAAGPSLEGSLDALKAAKGKAIIIAVDRIVQYLLDKGIRPDFVVSLDPKKDVTHFSTGAEVDIPMFCLVSSQPLIMDRQTGRKIVCFATYYLYKQYFNALGDCPNIPLSSSAATFAVEIAGYLGAKKVCLVGQDLAYYGETTHVGGVVSNPSGTAKKWVDGVNGEKVLTRYDWLEFINWFENYIVKNPNITIIDTKKQGALIKGSVSMDLEEAIGERKASVASLIERINQISPTFTQEQFQEIEKQIKVDLEELDTIKKKAKEGVGYCTDLINMVKQGKVHNRSLDSKVEKVKAITKYLKELEFYKNLDDVVIAKMKSSYVKVFSSKEDENENLINVYDSSRSFFEAVVEVVKIIEPIMKETIEKF